MSVEHGLVPALRNLAGLLRVREKVLHLGDKLVAVSPALDLNAELEQVAQLVGVGGQ